MGSSYNTQTRQSHDLFFVWSTPGRLARHINMLRTITEEPISNNSAADKKRTSMFRKFSCGGSKKRLSNEGQKLFCGNSDEPSTEVSVVKIKRLLYSIFYTQDDAYIDNLLVNCRKASKYLLGDVEDESTPAFIDRFIFNAITLIFKIAMCISMLWFSVL